MKIVFVNTNKRVPYQVDCETIDIIDGDIIGTIKNHIGDTWDLLEDDVNENFSHFIQTNGDQFTFENDIELVVYYVVTI